MRAERRGYLRRPMVTLTMPLSEFREHVEWLEGMAPEDRCTQDWREELGRLDPPDREDDW